MYISQHWKSLKGELANSFWSCMSVRPKEPQHILNTRPYVLDAALISNKMLLLHKHGLNPRSHSE